VISTDGVALEDKFNEARIANEVGDTDSVKWWLRTPGYSNETAVVVMERGAVLVYGASISNRVKDEDTGAVHVADDSSFVHDIGIRPALWLDLRSLTAVEATQKSKDGEMKEKLLKSFAPLLEKYGEEARAVKMARIKQSEEWKSKGLCLHCGSDKIGFFGICKSCKKSAKKSIEFDDGISAYVDDDLWVHVRFAGHNWIALTVRNGMALLLCDKTICNKGYHYDMQAAQFDTVNWESCALRKYLNSFLFYDLISQRDKARIAQAYNTTSNCDYVDAHRYKKTGNITTSDYIFLLSVEEMEEYFWKFSKSDSQNHSRSVATDGSGKACHWWLRSPPIVKNHLKIACIGTDGSLEHEGRYFHDKEVGVRPALWLKLD
jgi:hypothetical protein